MCHREEAHRAESDLDWCFVCISTWTRSGGRNRRSLHRAMTVDIDWSRSEAARIYSTSTAVQIPSLPVPVSAAPRIGITVRLVTPKELELMGVTVSGTRTCPNASTGTRQGPRWVLHEGNTLLAETPVRAGGVVTLVNTRPVFDLLLKSHLSVLRDPALLIYDA